MKVHLVDGTYELFRSFYGPPPKKAPDGREVGATIGLLRSLISLLSDAMQSPSRRKRRGRSDHGSFNVGGPDNQPREARNLSAAKTVS